MWRDVILKVNFTIQQKKSPICNRLNSLMSGRQDSNLRPPGPKPGALTELRYAPYILTFL